MTRASAASPPSAAPPPAVPTGVVPSLDQRRDVCLAPLLATEQRRFPVTPDKAVIGHPARPFAFSERRCAAYLAAFELDERPTRRDALVRRYFTPMIEAHQRLGIDRRFQVVFGDHKYPSPSPSFHKARFVAGCGLDVLTPLGWQRHFGRVAKVNLISTDLPFEARAARLVWRGATTGSFSATAPGSRYHVYRRWEALSRHPDFDIGFSALDDAAKARVADGTLTVDRCLKEKLDAPQQFRSKYLLSLEGNDVASGLKWMLASGSVVLMPRPTVVSWACETFLVPGVHYVEVRDDLEDLEEVFAWCEAHPAVCREIAANARALMAPFTDERAETELFDEVVRQYQRRVRFYDPEKVEAPGGRPGAA